MSHLSELFRQARAKLSLSRPQVANRAGYKNIIKGIRRLDWIEQGRDWFPHQDLLERFSQALQIDEADLIQSLCLDFCDLDQPVLPKITVRLFPAYYAHLRLPLGCTTEEAIDMAVEYSRKHKLHTWVSLSRVRSLAITPSGQRSEVYGGAVCAFGAYGREAVRLAKQASRVVMERPTQGDK